MSIALEGYRIERIQMREEECFCTCREATKEKSAAMLNRDLGVTYQQVAAMQAGSMFSWNVPAADPKNYDESGRPIVKNRDGEAR